MSVVTAVKYDVLEHILQKWLVKTFGSEASYEVSSKKWNGIEFNSHPLFVINYCAWE